MARIPDRRTFLKACSALLILVVAGGGIFFVLAPYQASRLRADMVSRLHTRGEAPLVLATAAEDGAYFKLGNVLRQHLDAAHSYALDVRPTLGSVENLRLLQEETADLAFIQGGMTTEREGLVALANLGRQYVHLVVPADSSIEGFRDLAGKRLGVGAKGSGSESLAESVTRFFNFADETTLIYDHNPDLREAFLDGEIDAAFTVYGLFAPAMEQLLGEGWYRLVPVREAEAVSRYLPGVFAETLPPSLYGPDRSIPPESPEGFPTLAVNTLLVAQRTLPDRQVYTVLEQIFSGDFLKAARLTDLDEEVAQEALHLPMHVAAEAFYNRRNPISADRFEILSFFLAGIVCLASVVHYLLGHHRYQLANERRKAIRPYFEAMMDFGDEIEGASNPSALTRLIHKIMATQRGAEREWLEGHFDTEDMENLYAVYSLRCNNAFNKIFDLHFQAMRGVKSTEPPRSEREEEPPARTTYRRPEPESPSTVRNAYPRVERDEKPSRFLDDDDAFFAGSALAGIDTTKKELAERLPSRYDPGLLYDTEASGAGSVRIRTSKPQADLQAVVEKDVPVTKPAAPKPAQAPAAPSAAKSAAKAVRKARVNPEPEPDPEPDPEPESKPVLEPVAEPDPFPFDEVPFTFARDTGDGSNRAVPLDDEGDEDDEDDDKPDQLMLF